MRRISNRIGPVNSTSSTYLTPGLLYPRMITAMMTASSLLVLQAPAPASAKAPSAQTFLPPDASLPTLALISARYRLNSLAQTQGIEGTVFLISGNRMPSPDAKTGLPKPVPAIVCIYEQTNIDQVTRRHGSSGYSSIATRKILEAKTDSAGHFRISLPTGRYSVFAKAGGTYYANGSDIHNNLASVEVISGKMTSVSCRIEGERPAVY